VLCSLKRGKKRLELIDREEWLSERVAAGDPFLNLKEKERKEQASTRERKGKGRPFSV